MRRLLIFVVMLTGCGLLLSPCVALAKYADGDIAPQGNRDGVVDIPDALACLHAAVGATTLSGDDLRHADVAPLGAGAQPAPNGVVNIADAVLVLRKAIGLVNFVGILEPFEIDDDKDGYTENQGDLNDADATIYPGAVEVCGDGIDQDCNGADQLCPIDIDDDRDGYTENQGDLNDADATIYPGAVEVCGDGIDQDCSGFDLICPNDIDDDKDGYTENQGDMNDSDATIYPGAPEVCGDRIDQDCNGTDQLCPNDIDDDKDGYTENQGDLNDSDATIYPGAVEVCGDGIDQDCNGTDQLCPNDSDDDKDGYTENQGDLNDADATIYPGAPEVCGDGIDQDCNGTDQLCPNDIDDDKDGYTENQGDLNDSDATIYPGAAEIYGDGIDQDCNGVDETVAITNEDIPLLISWEFSLIKPSILFSPEHGELKISCKYEKPPLFVGSNSNGYMMYINNLTVVENIAYATTENGFLYIIDINDSKNPVLLGFYQFWLVNDTLAGVSVTDGMAFVAVREGAVHIINVSDPRNPTLIATYDTTGVTTGLVVLNHIAYIADGDNGLLILDVNDPAHPTYIGSYDTPGFAARVTVVGSLAYIADTQSGIQIVDVSNPTHPNLVGSYDTAGSASEITVVGDIAYIADHNRGLQIINVKDPVHPFAVASFDTQVAARFVKIVDGLAYISEAIYGLLIVDVNDPYNPYLLGSYDTPGTASEIVVVGSLVYMADNGSGLLVLSFEPSSCLDFIYKPNLNYNGSDTFFLQGLTQQGLPLLEQYTITINQTYDPPVANAGPDQEVRRNGYVQLNARGSLSPDGLPLTYQWSQTGGALVFMDDNESATPQLIAPDVHGELAFELRVSDGTTTVTDTVKIFVVYDPPAADAGEALTAGRQQTVQLDASQSMSPEGATLTFSWSQTAGNTVTLDNPNSSTPVFVAPDTFGSLTFQVIVSDGYGSSIDTVTVDVTDRQPVANAGADQSVVPGTLVTLDGSSSNDLDSSDTLTYHWALIWGPDGVTLSDNTIAAPNFTAPAEASLLVFELTVDDGMGGRSVDQVTINVEPPPVIPLAAQVANVALAIPSGSDLVPATVTYATFGSSASLDTTGSGTAEILDGGAPSLGITTDGSGEPCLLGVHIPASLAIYLDRFPELAAYLAGSGTSTVDATSTALGLLLMNPYMLQADGVQRMAFLGTALAHPAFNTLRDRINVLSGVPGNRLNAVLNDLQVKTTYAQIVSDLADMVLPELEMGEPFNSGSASAARALFRAAASTANDEGRQLEARLRRPSPELRNPYFVFYSANIIKDPENSTDTVWQFLHRRTSLLELSWFKGVSLPKYAATPYPFKPNTPYHLDLSSEDGLSTLVGMIDVMSIMIGLDSFKIEPTKYIELAKDMDFTPALNLGVNASKGDWTAVAADMGNLVAENYLILSEWGMNQLFERAGTGLETGIKTFLTAAVGNANLVGWGIKGAKLINGPAPLLYDLVSAPEGCEMDVQWDLTMGYDDVLISTPCVPKTQHTPVLQVTTSTVSGPVPLLVSFDASGSTDPDGDSLYYSYNLNPQATTPSATTPVYTHTFSRPGVYTMRAAVSDGKFGDYEDITITASPAAVNTAPSANAGPDQTVALGSTVQLNGLTSSDPDGNTLTWQWRQIAGPPRALQNPRTATPRFKAPTVNDVLVFELTVSDGQYQETDLVQVVVGTPSGGALSIPLYTTINEGSTVTTSIDLSQPVGQDLVVWLSATPADTVKIPSYVIVPAGGTTMTFSLEGLTDSDWINDDFTLQAEAAGWGKANVNGQVVEVYSGDIGVSTSGASGAQWTISGPGLSGAYSGARTFNNVVPGSYTVTYQAVSGYYTPSPETKSIGASGYVSFSGAYSQVPVNTADLYVSTSGAPNATWSISGPGASGTYSGSRTFSNVTPGTYTVTYNSASGYYTPSAQTKSVGSSGTYNFVGTYYTQSLGDVTVTKKTNIQLTLYDHSVVDGDIIDVYLNGSKILSSHTLAGPPGTVKNITLNSGANTLVITALNEGTDSPNTATIVVSDVSSGDPNKIYELYRGGSSGFNLVAP